MALARRSAALPQLVLALVSIAAALGSENKAESVFDRTRAGLTTAMQIKCPSGGEKIRVTDVYYRINSCRMVEFRPDDAVSATNARAVEHCTGERLCVLREADLTSPYLAGKQGCPNGGQANAVVVIYKCVPQDKIRPLCSSFEAMDAEGYLATQHYPMDMNATEGKSACVCDLRATGSGRVRLTFVELQLASESSHVDPAACQRERAKQYVQLRYSYGMSTAYYLCSHRYNVEPEPSQVYKLIFENPVVGRRVGKLWIEYAVSNDDINDMIKVTCYELQTTAMAVKKRPPAMPDLTAADSETADAADGDGEQISNAVLAAIFAAILFVAAAVVVATACYLYRRKMAKCLRQRQRSSSSPSSARGSATDARSPRRLLGAAKKPTALIVPTSKESESDTEADTDMDVKGYHPFETFIYTKPCKATPVQVEMPETPPPPAQRQPPRLPPPPPSLLDAAYSRVDIGGCYSGGPGGGGVGDDRSSSTSSFSSRDDRDSSGSYFGTGSNVTTIRRGPPSTDGEEGGFPPPPPPPPVDLDSAAQGAAASSA